MVVGGVSKDGRKLVRCRVDIIRDIWSTYLGDPVIRECSVAIVGLVPSIVTDCSWLPIKAFWPTVCTLAGISTPPAN
jgi:hypothetical protein